MRQIFTLLKKNWLVFSSAPSVRENDAAAVGCCSQELVGCTTTTQNLNHKNDAMTSVASFSFIDNLKRPPTPKFYSMKKLTRRLAMTASVFALTLFSSFAFGQATV